MTELNQAHLEHVSGGAIALGVWAIFISGYGCNAFDKIGSEIGNGLYDAMHGG
jgi:hypothetical protein